MNIPKERAYPEYQFKPIIIEHGCVKLEKMEMEDKHICACFQNFKKYIYITICC